MFILKKGLFLSFLMFTYSICAQQSEALIPRDASTVFSINNINLLQKISIDELVEYDFMEELHQELFDGSTAGKTLKDAGLDFDQRLNIFYGKDKVYELTGFSFGIKNKVELFQVFDDFEYSETLKNGAERYNSLFNTLIIKGNSGVLLRIQPTDDYLVKVTDSLNYYEWDTPDYFDTDGLPILEEALSEKVEPIEEEDGADLTSLDEYLERTGQEKNNKTYWEIRDSIQVSMQTKGMLSLIEDLIINENSLQTVDKRFEAQLVKDSEGIFFIDNSRNFSNQGGLWYFQTMYPIMNEDLKELYAQNYMVGDLHLDSNNVHFDLKANYGEELGSIYAEMNNNPLNKDFAKYIPKDAAAYFIYNVDLRKAYEKAYDILLPILKDKKDNKMVMNLLAIQLLDKFVDKKAFFGAYKGGIFGTFNGIQTILTKKIEYNWNDENFEYTEIETESEEDIPVFTLGFASERTDLCELVLSDLSRLTSRIEKKEGYWMIKDAIFDAAPLYVVCTDEVLLLSNDTYLIDEHIDGYGREAISKKDLKRIKKSGVLYANMDLDQSINQFPQAFLDERQKKVLNDLKNNSGRIEISSNYSELTKTDYSLLYNFESTSSQATQFLDMINAMFILAK
ncbi:MAG: hypothetical protein ISP69_01740 [Crocinitomicaceae bacterium]|nr:hypothetical protein [Crocinitomicaceae bacterium]